MQSILVFFAAMALATAPGCSPAPEPKTPKVSGLDELFERDKLVIVANDGSRHIFDVYLAIDLDQKRRGLMFVRNLPERTGMLFVYEDAAIHSMWMKNTYISLDIVFARSDGMVSSVIRDTQPLALRSLRSIEPVSFVLELNAGVARHLNIGAGSQLIWEPKPGQSTAAIESAR
ncbi:MAG: DUF192 domain-containing protein [Gammaproteobacteria bacterium]|nr:DUF192 domain-containing protein [Gammaproteobacteria bacterium]